MGGKSLSHIWTNNDFGQEVRSFGQVLGGEAKVSNQQMCTFLLLTIYKLNILEPAPK